MLASAGFRLFANPRAARTAPYGKDGREAILSLAAFGEAKREIMSWPGYKPTPLRSLPKLAARAVARLEGRVPKTCVKTATASPCNYWLFTNAIWGSEYNLIVNPLAPR